MDVGWRAIRAPTDTFLVYDRISVSRYNHVRGNVVLLHIDKIFRYSKLEDLPIDLQYFVINLQMFHNSSCC